MTLKNASTEKATNPLTVKSLLKKAAAILQKRGLAKRVQQDERGRVCVFGALLLADGKRPMRDFGSALVINAANVLDRSLGFRDSGGWSAATWNNDPKRTKKQVVAALLKAAR